MIDLGNVFDIREHRSMLDCDNLEYDVSLDGVQRIIERRPGSPTSGLWNISQTHTLLSSFQYQETL